MQKPEIAWKTLESHLRPLSPGVLPRRLTLGRVLASSVKATVDLPFAHVSAMDGYALKGEIALNQPIPVAGVIAAGDPPGTVLPEGQAMRIMTGAPLPIGSDRVIPVELSDGGHHEVCFNQDTPKGAHVRLKGEVVRAGEPLLEAGTPLTPSALSLLASHGFDAFPIHRSPRVAILTTGDEVIPPDQEPQPGQLRDSHTDFLMAAGRCLHLKFSSLGIAPDEKEALRELIQQGLKHDILLLGGGVSKGEFDYVEETLESLGVEILVESVAMKPGKPLVIARHPGGFVFGLPGNPGSVMCTFWLFVYPAIQRLMGHEASFWDRPIPVRLTSPLSGARGRDRFVTAQLEYTESGILATPLKSRGSHDMISWANADALVRISADTERVEAGDTVEATLLPSF